jgi:essential nuclear protein 1
MPKVSARTNKQRHTPLHVELDADNSVRQFGRVTAPGKRKGKQEDQEEEGVSNSKNKSKSKAGLVLTTACV